MKKIIDRYKKTIVMMMTGILLAIPASAKDYTGHWAEQTIDKWHASGVIKGEAEGVFNPNGEITRAQLTAFIDRLFVYDDVEKSARHYTDLEAESWYESCVKRVTSQGIMYLPGDKFYPNQAVTREEVAYALANAYEIGQAGKTEVVFSDADTISPWAQKSVMAMVNHGYLGGYTDGTIRPKGPISRAEFMSIIDRVTAHYFYEAGTYTEIGEGHVLINTGDVTIKNATITGNLYIAQGVGVEEVVLENVIVEGDVYIAGGKVSLSGTYQDIFIEHKGDVALLEGSAHIVDVTDATSKFHLHTGAIIMNFFAQEDTTTVIEGIVQGNNNGVMDGMNGTIEDGQALALQSAGVFVEGQYIDLPIQNNTITINLLDLQNRAGNDVLESMIIYANRSDASIQSHYGTGEMLANTVYTFKQADRSIGMIEDMLEQLKNISPDLKSMIEDFGLSPSTIFDVLVPSGQVSMSEMIEQYNTIRETAESFIGIKLDTTYAFERTLKASEAEDVQITVRLELE